MAELEKVIKGLECCEFTYYCPEECPYKPQENCVRYLHNDAIELLKGQQTKIDSANEIAIDERTNATWRDDYEAWKVLDRIAEILC